MDFSEVPLLPPVRLAAEAELASAVRATPLAAELLSLDGLETPVTADRLTEWMWRLATDTAFLELEDEDATDATPGPALTALLDGPAEDVVDAWADVCYTLLHPDEMGEEPVTLSLVQLFVAREPIEAQQLESDSPELLVRLGLVLATEDSYELTPLGLWAGRELAMDLFGQVVPIVGETAGQDAATLLHVLRSHPEQERAEELAIWLADKDQAKGAAEIAASLGAVSPLARAVGLDVLASDLGEDGTAAIEGLVAEPRLGALIAARLGRGDREPGPEEIAWVLTDMAASLLEYGGDAAELIESVSMGMEPEELASTIAILAFSDHEDTEAVLQVFVEHHPDGTVTSSARKALRRFRGLADERPGARGRKPKKPRKKRR